MHERRFNREIERLRDPERIERLEVKRVVNLSLEDLSSPHTVLDVGTGSGLFAQQFAGQGLKVTGLDVNPNMLSAARRYVPSGAFLAGTAEHLPFANRSFDLVFMGLLLHETDDAQAALIEARRVALQRLSVLEWVDEDQPFGPPREHRLSFEKIASLAQKAGFTSVDPLRLAHLMLYRIE